ncbi:MAG: aspartate--tRNA(Asn) ligase [Paludibacteraceae bacterium]|nr:aspartate--tRNA(Asn) ligase [Paludibacteraceae bacterium]
MEDFTIGSTVHVSGMIHNVRVTKWGGFIILRKPRGLVQTVVSEQSSFVNEHGEVISMADLCREMAVTITGTVHEANIKDPAACFNDRELAVEKVEVLSRPSTTEVIDMNALKFGDEETLLRYKFDNRQVTLRNPRDMAILKVQSTIAKAFADYLSEHEDFTQIFTPKIVSEGAEGGANVFKMDYFGKQVYLAQSPQFYKQIGVGVYERVFEIAPAYRAEKHATSRHLNEYISLDVEMGFIHGQEDVMALETRLLHAIIDRVCTSCAHELALLNATMPALPESVPTWRLSEVHEILFNEHLTEDHRGEDDLAPEEERAICKYALDKFGSDFVFVTHFPSQHRAFYAMDDPADPSLTLSFDLLMRGLEITSGGQRIHSEEMYREKMIRRGMNPDNFRFYLDTFKNGMPPHGGFAIGLERITACFLNIANVKEASMFPRDINRVAP